MAIRKKPAVIAGFLFVLSLALATSSCALLEPYFAFLTEWNFSFDDGGIQFASKQALLDWVATAIAYTSDEAAWGCKEYWASPEETFRACKGDCDDKAILFMYFAYTRGFSNDLEFVGIMLQDGCGHAIVRVGDTYYDPTRDVTYPVSSLNQFVMYRLNYGQTLYIASHDHAASRNTVPLGPY